MCGNVFDAGHGTPVMDLGSPLKKCNICKKEYIDMDIIEWSISPFYRKLKFFFANNRFWICIIPTILFVAISNSWMFGFVVFALFLFFCLLYVISLIKNDIENSKDRAKNKDYIDLLKVNGYPIKK